MPRTILITGATSGIGRALALHYAGPGTRLGLIGRDRGRLVAIDNACSRLGAEVRTGSIDVRDGPAVATWMRGFDAEWPVDLLIANAGVMAGTPPGQLIEPADEAYDLLAINVLGLQASVAALLPGMLERRGGTIAIMSSLAGFVPLPDAPSYSASKAAVMSYGLSLRHLLRPNGIRVSVICPGYVDTTMSDRENGPKPFSMQAGKAAEIIARGLDRDRALIVFPWFYGWLTRLAGVLPDSLQRWVLGLSRFTVIPPQHTDSRP